MEDLQTRWKYLYVEYLPSLARAKDASQPKWPVCLDHCFARIVLDNAIGKDKPWTEVVKSPAIKHMTEEQFQSAISLAENVASGEEDLVELDERSLSLRGKKSKRKAAKSEDDDENQIKKKSKTNDEAQAVKKRKRKTKDETISSYFLPSPASPRPKKDRDPANGSSPEDGKNTTSASADIFAQLTRIQNCTLTSFRKQTLSLLCQIPRGRYSTYQAMSDHISRTSHKTCARAVGNAMRNNPFAPEVPCHRILANDGSLGGFGGHWGEGGPFAGKKRELLKEEGVKFDSKGKVKGPPFREWR